MDAKQSHSKVFLSSATTTIDRNPAKARVADNCTEKRPGWSDDTAPRPNRQGKDCLAAVCTGFQTDDCRYEGNIVNLGMSDNMEQRQINNRHHHLPATGAPE